MDLFDNQQNESINLLPYNGIAYYYGKIMSHLEANQYLDALLYSIDWKNDETIIFGKHLISKRKVAWYGDEDFAYTYSNITKRALPWKKELLELKELTERITGECFNSCLLNLYHTGAEGMSWHSDGEIDLKKNGAIASISVGAERKFMFKHKDTFEKISITLEHGSLLNMMGPTQSYWLHRLPPSKVITKPRVNLTFRTIINTTI